MTDEREPDRTPDNDDGTAPLDVTALHADDEFVEALSRDLPVFARDETEYRLAGLLAGWRAESTPVAGSGLLVDVDEVERAIAVEAERARAVSGGALPEGRGRRVVRHLRVLSGAAAVVVVAAAGLIVVSEGSQPGDPLWSVKQVVFSEQATQTKAMVEVQSNLERAEAAVVAGDTREAVVLIERAEGELETVRDAETRRRIDEWIGRLRADAAPTTPLTKRSETVKPSVDARVAATSEPSKQPSQTPAPSDSSQVPSPSVPSIPPSQTPPASDTPAPSAPPSGPPAADTPEG